MPDAHKEPKNWKYTSPATPGFHTVISPENSCCLDTWCFRLNLSTGMRHVLEHDNLELSAVVIDGKVTIEEKSGKTELGRFDSFYLPARNVVTLSAVAGTTMYIGGAPDEGHGSFFVRKFDQSMPFGEVHQMHGEPPFRRDVFMTVNQEAPASRLITGLTWGEPGGWTSWPPHQHERDLEEVYCYFDIPSPSFALHFSYRKPGELETIHPVSSGDFVAVPRGYHPTVAMPGVRSTYFWVMSAHAHESRSYDRSVPDPSFAGKFT